MTIDETIADLRALLGDPEVVSVDLDVALALADEVERLRAIVEGRTMPPTEEEFEGHAAAGGAWLVTLPEVKQVRFKPETRYVDDLREAHRLWWCEGARWVAVMDGRPCAWPEVPRG